jgi:putative transposase
LAATLVRTVSAQPDAASTWAQHARILDQLTERFPAAAELLAAAGTDLLALPAVPKEHWRQRWSTPPERLNTKLGRRAEVVASSSHREAVIRLVGAAPAEQHDEWPWRAAT